jgi:hypothetical protein
VIRRLRVDGGIGGLRLVRHALDGHASVVQFERGVEWEGIGREDAEAALRDSLYRLGRPWARFPAVVLTAVLEPDLDAPLAAIQPAL